MSRLKREQRKYRISDIKSLIDIEKDILSHPEQDLSYLDDIFNSSIFKDSEIEDINNALSIILGDESLSEIKKLDYMNNLWRINYYEKPPSIEEFLTPKWIGLTSDSLYPYVRDILTTYFDPKSKKRHLLLALAIGMGKSTLSVLALLYVAILYNLLRNPKQYLNLAESAPVVITLLSFTIEKANDILVKPMLNVISSCDRYERCKMESQLIKKQKDYNHAIGSRILFTTAGEGSVLRMGDLLFKQVSDKSALLGLNIISAVISEINFFVERGASQDYINDLYWDIRGRIYSRIGNENYLARTILDSSVSSFENVIERYIWQESYKDETNMFVHMSKWQGQPDLFPIWNKDKNKVFPVFSGSASKPPKIINFNEIDNYEESKIIYMPEDIRTNAEQSLIKTLKDYASVPAGADDKLISNPETIEKMFNPNLKNFYTYIHAPSSQPPEDLLWEYVKKELFVHTGQGNLYEFYRYPNAERFLTSDLSVKHDMAGISMVHIEKNLNNEKVYVGDFTLMIVPTKEEINLEAIYYLILNLKKYGNINLRMTSFDQFQSSDARQKLNRHGIDSIRYSVDINTEPYLNFISAMNQGRVQVGRNLIIKNNMKSLVNRKMNNGKTKIDHEVGDFSDFDNLDWNTSRMGYYGKDGTDSLVGACALADLYGTDSSEYIWNPQLEEKKKTQAKEIMLEDVRKTLNLKVRTATYQRSN